MLPLSAPYFSLSSSLGGYGQIIALSICLARAVSQMTLIGFGFELGETMYLSTALQYFQNYSDWPSPPYVTCVMYYVWSEEAFTLKGPVQHCRNIGFLAESELKR